MKGRGYPVEIAERTVALAKVIREIEDLTQRTEIARGVCLTIVTKYSCFPESRFLQACGVACDDRQGPALRVKKTKHSVRTVSCGKRFTPIAHKVRMRKKRQLNGHEVLECGEAGDRSGTFHKLCVPAKRTTFSLGYKMY
jgi:hypothetical protein